MNRPVCRALGKLAVLAAVGASTWSSPSGTARAQDAPARQFQREINDSRDAAEEGKQLIAQLEFNAQESGDVAVADIAEAMKFFDGYVKRWTTVAELFVQGKPDNAQKLRSEAWASSRGRDRWRERIGIRSEQVRTAPTPEWLAREKTWTPPEARYALDNYLEASKRVSESWGKLADAMTPEATEEQIRSARHNCKAAVAARDLAGSQLQWSRESAYIVPLRGASPQLDAKLKEMEKIQSQVAENYQAKVELDRKIDDTEAARLAALEEARNLADLARKAK